MTFKRTIGPLAFVLAASVSSLALAQSLGLGVAANTQVGIAPSGFNPNASINNRSGTTIGAGLDNTAAAAQANAHDAPLKTARIKQSGAAKTSAKAKVEVNASAKLPAPNPH